MVVNTCLKGKSGETGKGIPCTYAGARCDHHDSNIPQLTLSGPPATAPRLVNALDDEPGHNRTWFIIHIDAKADSVHGELTKTFKDRTNVIVMDEGR